MGSTDTSRARLAALSEASEAFHSRFIRAGALGIGAVSLLVAALGAVNRNFVGVVFGLVGALIYGAAYALTYRRGGLPGRRLFVHSLVVLSFTVAIFEVPDSRTMGVYIMAVALSVTLAGFVLTRGDMLIALVIGLVTLGHLAWRYAVLEGVPGRVLTAYIVTGGLILVQVLAISLITARSRTDQATLQAYVNDVDRVMEHAQRIARGDLAAPIEGESDVSEMLRIMVDGLQLMVKRTRESAAALAASAQQIEALARQQEQGAVEQASAVTEVHRTLATLLEGSSHAARSTEEVFQNVERTQRTSEVVAQRAAALSAHTRRISAILEIIKNIANKSEILALNAALEGARAGEAGRGFSLVASQMARLAESVTDSVRDVRGLIEDIEAATAATLAATEESTALSAKATGAARQIGVTLQQQRSSTEQVAAAMADIQHVTAQVSAGSSQSLAATRDLARLADELKRAIEGFQIA